MATRSVPTARRGHVGRGTPRRRAPLGGGAAAGGSRRPPTNIDRGTAAFAPRPRRRFCEGAGGRRFDVAGAGRPSCNAENDGQGLHKDLDERRGCLGRRARRRRPRGQPGAALADDLGGEPEAPRVEILGADEGHRGEPDERERDHGRPAMAIGTQLFSTIAHDVPRERRLAELPVLAVVVQRERPEARGDDAVAGPPRAAHRARAPLRPARPVPPLPLRGRPLHAVATLDHAERTSRCGSRTTGASSSRTSSRPTSRGRRASASPASSRRCSRGSSGPARPVFRTGRASSRRPRPSTPGRSSTPSSTSPKRRSR